MKRKLLSILLGLCMVVTLMPAAAWADVDVNSYENPAASADAQVDANVSPQAGGGVQAAQSTGDEHSHYLCCEENCNEVGGHSEIGKTTFATEIKMDGNTLKKGDSEWSANDSGYTLTKDTYYLSTDITLNEKIVISGNVTLCLNGHSITQNGNTSEVIDVHDGNLTLTDCKGGDTEVSYGKITHEKNCNGRGVYIGNSGAFNMYGGNITGNSTASGKGGGVYMDTNTTFNMYGGSITKNEVTSSSSNSKGGGVYVGGKFIMNGGTISENNASSDGNYNGLGGGVYVDGTFAMYDGSITSNSAGSGGGVYMNTGKGFWMFGGSITNNTTSSEAGGVRVSSNCIITVKGNVKITDNKANNSASNVCLTENLFITIVAEGLSEEAKIGVKTYKEPEASNPIKIASGQNGCNIGETTKNALYPDAGEDNYHFELTKDGGYDVIKMFAGAKPHKHYLCGGSDCNKVGHSEETTETEFTAWTSDNSLPTETGNYYLTKDVELGSSWAPADGVVLCLNGHTITGPDGDNAINVQSGEDLTLTDCAKDKVGKVTHAENTTGCGVYVYGGRFTMYGGSIAKNGSGVHVYSGIFTMNGGTITGNNANGGGGVYVGGSGSSFTMNGGSISSNNATWGGGVYVGSGSNQNTFTMNGGIITNNETIGSSGYGGGVCVNGGMFTMAGGSITGNKATAGGGVYAGGTFTVNKAVIIKDNVNGDNSPNNVCLPSSNTITIGGEGLNDNAKIGVTTWSKDYDTVNIANNADEKKLADYKKIFSMDKSKSGYDFTVNNKKLTYGPHQHSWNYTLKEDTADTITATCKDCSASGGSVTITAPTDLIYSGSTKAATVTASSDWQGDAVDDSKITYKQGGKALSGEPVNAGTYTASITVGDVLASVEYTIQPKTVTPTVTVADGSVYNNGEEVKPAVTVKDGDTEISASEYNIAYSNNINAGTGTVTVTDKDGGNYKINTVTQDFTINRADYKNVVKEMSVNVPTVQFNSGSYNINKLTLPELPEGATYEGSVILSSATKGDETYPYAVFPSGCIEENWKGGTERNLTFKTAGCEDGYSATMTFHVIGTSNYNEYDVIVTVKFVKQTQETLNVSMTGWTYGDAVSQPSYTKPEDTFRTTITYAKKKSDGTYENPTTYLTSDSDAGEYKVTVVCETPLAVYTGSKEFKIEKKTISATDLKLQVGTEITKVYDGTDKHNEAVYLTLKDNSNFSLGVDKDKIVYNSENVKDANKATLTLSIPAGMNYKLADNLQKINVNASITPRPIAVANVTAQSRDYQKGNKNVNVDVTFNNLPEGVTLTAENDYTVTGVMNTDAATGDASENTVQVSVKLKNSNYSMTDYSDNTIVKIWKLVAPTVTVDAINQKWSDTVKKEIIPQWQGIPADAGNLDFNIIENTYPTDITLGNSSIDTATGKLTYTLTGATAAHVGQKITLKIKISMQNYTETEATLVINIIDKNEQNGFAFEDNTPSVTKNYGDADFTVKASGQVTGSTVTYSSSDENVATVDNTGKVTIIGAGTATISAKASETTDYAEKTVSYTLTVNKKQITAPTADSTEYTYNGKEQTYKLAENEAYTIKGNTQTNANESGYTVTVSLKDKKNTEWADKTSDDKTYRFTIKKATITIAAKNQTEYVGKTAPTLGEDSYTVSGLFGEDKLTTNPTIKYVDAEGNEATPDMTKTGEMIIHVSGADAGENYTISYTNGKLTVFNRPSGGGSTIQKPTIIADAGADTKLSYNGRNLTIAAEEGYEITDVLVNGVSKGKVTEVTGLRTGDKVEVKAAQKAEPTDPAADKNAKLIKGVENTSIILKSKLTKAGKVLLTWTKSKGYKVDYFEVYRSVKKNSGYGKKPFFTTKDGSWSKYLNTKNLKKGKTYYYKVRGVRLINDRKYYTKYSNKAWRTIK